jgi:hypothetical protein
MISNKKRALIDLSKLDQWKERKKKFHFNLEVVNIRLTQELRSVHTGDLLPAKTQGAATATVLALPPWTSVQVETVQFVLTLSKERTATVDFIDIFAMTLCKCKYNLRLSRFLYKKEKNTSIKL